MELFAKLFDSLLVFVCHCFDRIVIHGYLNGLSRPEQVVYFFHQVLGIPVVDKEVLSRRTNDYRNWAARSASACRSIPHRTPTTALSPTSGAASRITTSTSATRKPQMDADER